MEHDERAGVLVLPEAIDEESFEAALMKAMLDPMPLIISGGTETMGCFSWAQQPKHLGRPRWRFEEA